MDDDTASTTDDDRTTEFSSIAAIFPELSIDPSDRYTATLELPVSPVKPLRIQFKQASDNAPPLSHSKLPTPPTSSGSGHGSGNGKAQGDSVALPQQADTYELEHLPPLRLKITLQDTYPVTEAPKVHLNVSPSWLPNTVLGQLRNDCSRLWEELGRDQVVYSYIDHLQQQADDAFGLAPSDGQPSPEVAMSSDLKLALLDFDLKTKQERFEKETFDCGICLEPKKGKDCHRLMLCGHVFCSPCLKAFYDNCISEGDVDNVKCLSPKCGVEEQRADEQPAKKRRKQDRTLNPSELLQIPIEQELVQRYVRLKRKKKLEADKNTVYCPRQWCQGAAKSKKHPKPNGMMDDSVSDTDEEAEVDAPEPTSSAKAKKKKSADIPMSQRLAVCEDCDFAFCSVCRKGWHGELSICNPRRQAELNAEEQASVAYLQKYSRACPTCNAPSQKSMGCNHMICFKCKTHFCYLCGSYLMEDNPYRHFNDMRNTCYMRLWELETGDGTAVGQELGGGEVGWEAPLESSDEEDDDEEDDDLPQRFHDFGGDEPLFLADDSTDDDEPAPDVVQRQRAIEIVNFARNGANRRIVLPERPQAQQPAPPAVPEPPRRNQVAQRRRRNGPVAHRNRNIHNEGPPDRYPIIPPPMAVELLPAPRIAPREPNLPFEMNREDLLLRNWQRDHPAAGPDDVAQQEANPEPVLIQALPAPGQDRFAAMQPAPVRAMGLERFLELARQDLEDEWDSDELSDDAADDQDDQRSAPGAREGNWAAGEQRRREPRNGPGRGRGHGGGEGGGRGRARGRWR